MADQVKANPLTVDVVEFEGRNGGFATSDTVMWRVEINNSKESKVVTGPTNSKKNTDQSAFFWAEFLGCEIREIDENKTWIPKVEQIIKAVG